MTQRDDYEFKVMLSELSISERGSTLAEVVRRWLRRHDTRQWCLTYIAPWAWVVG